MFEGLASGQDNLDMLNETKASIETEINQTRLAINGYLDKLEIELLTSGTRSLQFLWHVNTHFRQHTFSCSLQYVWYFSRCSSQSGLIPTIKGGIFLYSSSGSVQEMEHLFDDLTKNIKTIIASGKDNLDMLNETKAGIETEINQTRLAINGYLDKLEKELLTKLQEASDSVKDQIMELVATLAESLQVELDLCNFCGM
jgi:hypothetical protein